jgi:hypothetical protein
MERKGGAGLACEAAVSWAGGRASRLRVFDLNAEGCKIAFAERPTVGERLVLKFEGLEAVPAILRWVAGDIGRVAFEHPLSEAALQRLRNSAR